MSMRNERPDPIDAVIDDAARRLVAGEPSSALRSIVRERIGRRRSAWSFVPAFAGVAALLVLAVIVGRAWLGPSGEPDRVRPTRDLPLTNGVAPAVVSHTNDQTPTQPAQIRTRQFTRRAAVVPAPPDEEPIVPPIAIEPLATVPLTAVQIAADQSSGVMPIDIAPLQIEPLLGQ
jgi:hypothetical protein